MNEPSVGYLFSLVWNKLLQSCFQCSNLVDPFFSARGFGVDGFQHNGFLLRSNVLPLRLMEGGKDWESRKSWALDNALVRLGQSHDVGIIN
jgi:hypothetical protein